MREVIFHEEGYFHENRGLLNNYLHVLCGEWITTVCSKKNETHRNMSSKGGGKEGMNQKIL